MKSDELLCGQSSLHCIASTRAQHCWGVWTLLQKPNAHSISYDDLCATSRSRSEGFASTPPQIEKSSYPSRCSDCQQGFQEVVRVLYRQSHSLARLYLLVILKACRQRCDAVLRVPLELNSTVAREQYDTRCQLGYSREKSQQL